MLVVLVQDRGGTKTVVHHTKQEFRNQDEGRHVKNANQQVLNYFDLELRAKSLSISDVSMTDDDQSMHLCCDEVIVVQTRSYMHSSII